MESAADAIAGLKSAIQQPPGRNDLGVLARLHTWVQVLGATASGSGAAGLAGLCRASATLIERIILDEVNRPDDAVALLPALLTVIERAAGGVDAGVSDMRTRVDALLGGAPLPAADLPPSPPEPQAVSAPPPVADAPPAAPAPPPATAAATAAKAAIEPYVSEPLKLDLDEREHLQGFLDEAAEHMDAIESGLLAVESNPGDTNQLNELFRPFHTIKGIAGFLNLRDVNRLTHEIETILDLGRRSEMQITAAVVDLIFTAVDSLKLQLAEMRNYLAAPSGGPCPQPDIRQVMYALRCAAAGQYSGESAPSGRTGSTPSGAGGSVAVAASGSDDAEASARRMGGAEAGKSAALDHSIRVDTSKLDTLVDAVGELVIAQSMVGLSEIIRTDEKLARNVSQVTKIVRDVQETAMAMRMVPIGATFQKMRRLVRDVSRKAGKQVELVISGEETELDKNVIQQISDPLVHMVRNAVDHGIETPDQRCAAGKPEVGQVSLNAFHQGDCIVIEIRDDGRGLDREKLIAKAIEKGLVSPDDHLTDQQAFALIFAPGFSTAEQVTDISGRGVGMDVVRRNVEQLRGKIDIQSQLGVGSTFSIRLPLTLAIIDGMLVRVGTERLIIPTILIEQSLRPERRQITSVQKRGQMVQVRGELCPLIQLGALFGYCPPVDPCGSLVVIVQCETTKIALVVEELIGQQQVVIKTLGERFKGIRGVSGAAILGDGRVGLILEPSGLLGLHVERGSPVYEPAETTTTEATALEVAESSATGTFVEEAGEESVIQAPDEPALATV
ncbi:MAG: chemotaxis protein CheA [Phycisphaerales bacterium]|nr:chemotaxis protein CheA [Phycisphaerales bacterium]